eukprot:COSAG04_NODE_319_length_16893_cov_23.060141_7_plen_94_part_00
MTSSLIESLVRDSGTRSRTRLARIFSCGSSTRFTDWSLISRVGRPASSSPAADDLAFASCVFLLRRSSDEMSGTAIVMLSTVSETEKRDKLRK